MSRRPGMPEQISKDAVVRLDRPITDCPISPHIRKYQRCGKAKVNVQVINSHFRDVLDILQQRSILIRFAIVGGRRVQRLLPSPLATTRRSGSRRAVTVAGWRTKQPDLSRWLTDNTSNRRSSLEMWCQPSSIAKYLMDSFSK